MSYKTNATAGPPGRYTDEVQVPTKAQRALGVEVVTAVLNCPEGQRFELYRRGRMVYAVKMTQGHKESA